MVVGKHVTVGYDKLLRTWAVAGNTYRVYHDLKEEQHHATRT